MLRKYLYAFGLYAVAWGGWQVVLLVAAPAPITVRATPMVGFAPLAVTIDVHVIPEPEDRTIWVTSEPFPGIGQTEIPLEGANGARVHHRVWKIAEPGEYTIRVEVGNTMKRRAYATTRLDVR